LHDTWELTQAPNSKILLPSFNFSPQEFYWERNKLEHWQLDWKREIIFNLTIVIIQSTAGRRVLILCSPILYMRLTKLHEAVGHEQCSSIPIHQKHHPSLWTVWQWKWQTISEKKYYPFSSLIIFTHVWYEI
jgi:hypothetical protein